MKKIDAASFEVLFKEHYVSLFHFALKFVSRQDIAEEIVQTVFTNLWEKRHNLILKSSIKAYLFTAVRNQCLNHLNSQWHQATQGLQETLLINIATPNPSEFDQEVLHQLVQQGIEQLPEKCRIIFTLSRQAGLTYDEISTELSISKETVKSQIKIALKRLRQFLGQHWDLMAIGTFFIKKISAVFPLF